MSNCPDSERIKHKSCKACVCFGCDVEYCQEETICESCMGEDA